MKFVKKPYFKVGDKVKSIKDHEVQDWQKFEIQNPNQSGRCESGDKLTIEGYVVTGDAWGSTYWCKDQYNKLISLQEKYLVKDD